MTGTTLLVNEQGRVTIPAPLRRELGIEPGSSMVAYIEDGRLILEDYDHLAERIQREAAAARSASGPIVEELIAERRAEAKRERSEMKKGR